MEPERFWQLIESSRTTDDPLPSLGLALEELPREELVAFQRQLERMHAQACRADLRGAAYLTGGDPSEESFSDFRYGLIGLGQAVYEAALADADSLAAQELLFCDGMFGYVAREVYEATYGEPLPPAEDDPAAEPAGEDWDFEDPEACAHRLPCLWEKYGG